MKIAIVGCGIAGMSAAYDLVNAGHQVEIFEAAAHPGGLAAGFREPNWEWSLEQFYHHWFLSDSEMLGLIDELGWKDRVVIRRPVTVMYHNGKFFPFDSISCRHYVPRLGLGNQQDPLRVGWPVFAPVQKLETSGAHHSGCLDAQVGW